MTRQQLLLTQLSEECGEVIKNVSKAIRFGIEEGYPNQTETNAEAIARELNDVLAIVGMLIKDGILSNGIVNDGVELIKKEYKVEEWLEYSKKQGVLTD